MDMEYEFKAAVSGFRAVTDEVKVWAEQANREIKLLGRVSEDTKCSADKAIIAVNDIETKMKNIEQIVSKRQHGGGSSSRRGSWGGQALTASEGFKSFVANGMRGTTVAIECKDLTSASGSAGAFVVPDIRTTSVELPQRRLTIRDLVSPGSTTSNTVFFPVQTVRMTAAAMVAEDPSAIKPQSNYVWTQPEFPVRTLAHWVPASRQVLDDAPALQSLVDGELRYGLQDIEEQQLLSGDGTGQNLHGIIPQATAFNASLMTGVVSPTMIDVLLMAVAQAETALLPATGMVLHPLDWAKILSLKDSQNRYLAGGPLASAFQTFWSIPKVSTVAISQGTFLTGAFRDGAQIFDRSLPTVLISSEDRSNFVNNMLTILAEQRLAFAVKRGAAFITGSLTPPS